MRRTSFCENNYPGPRTDDSRGFSSASNFLGGLHCTQRTSPLGIKLFQWRGRKGLNTKWVRGWLVRWVERRRDWIHRRQPTLTPRQKTEKNNALSKVTAQRSNCDNKVSRSLVLLHLAKHSTGPLPHNSRPALVLLHLTRGSRTGQSSKTDPLPRHESGGVLPEQHFITAQIYLFLLTNISINYRNVVHLVIKIMIIFFRQLPLHDGTSLYQWCLLRLPGEIQINFQRFSWK